MLHIKGRQGSSQGFYSVTFILFCVCILLVSCNEQKSRELTEAERSAFGEYVNQMDSTLIGVWFDRMGVSADADSMLSYLNRELPRNGLDKAAFFVPEIERIGISMARELLMRVRFTTGLGRYPSLKRRKRYLHVAVVVNLPVVDVDPFVSVGALPLVVYLNVQPSGMVTLRVLVPEEKIWDSMSTSGAARRSLANLLELLLRPGVGLAQ